MKHLNKDPQTGERYRSLGKRTLQRLAQLTAVMSLLLMPVSTFAATEAPGWLEETMFASGKINTVVMVVSVVFIGLAIWMFNMDRKIGKLEKGIRKSDDQTIR